MSTLYFQLESGAAGDMLAAALLDVVPDPDASLRRLRSLGLPGVGLSLSRSSRAGLAGNLFDVTVDGETELQGHDHRHSDHHCHPDHSDRQDAHGHHGHTSISEVRERIDALDLPRRVRDDARAVYDLIAEAESKAHGRPVEQIHFHEVGSLDALADVVCVCSLISELSPDRIVASPPNAGGGTVRCAHGVLPVPAPATANLLEGLPWRGDAPESGELLTPTGAALLRRFVSAWGPAPCARWLRCGVGLGHRETPGRANAVRAFFGEGTVSAGGPNGRVSELLCNIDDMTGEALGFACGRLRAVAGALDVSLSPLQMKKGRAGHLLRVLCAPESADAVAAAILRETSTFGVRRADLARYELSRSFEDRPAPGGGAPVPWKIGSGYGTVKAKPEFDALAGAGPVG